MLKFIFSLILLLFLSITKLTAQLLPGDVDISFNPDDIGYEYGDKSHGGCGKIFNYYNNTILNSCDLMDGYLTQGIILLNKFTGDLDSSFFKIDPKVKSLRVFAVQMDYKVICLARFKNQKNQFIIRLLKTGMNDSTFSPVELLNGEIYEAKVQPDGKILLGGTMIKINNIDSAIILCISNDGIIDKDFHIPKLIMPQVSRVRDIEIQVDGSILLGGSFFNYDNFNYTGLVKLNQNGTVDTTYNGFETAIEQMTLLSNNRLLVWGYDRTFRRTGMIRFSENGEKDSSFKYDFKNYIPGLVWDLKTLSNGKIVLCGELKLLDTFSKPFITNLLAFDSTGKTDPDFNYGWGTLGSIWGISVTDNDTIYIGGGFEFYNQQGRNGIAKILPNGVLDNYFYKTTGFNGIGPFCDIQTIVNDGYDNFYCGGIFSRYNGSGYNSIIRIRNDGTIDTTFNPGFGLPASSVRKILLQSNHDIIVLGSFDYYNNDSVASVIRIKPNGKIDSAFKFRSPLLRFPNFIAQDFTGNLWITGYVNLNNLIQPCLLKTDSNGKFIDGTLVLFDTNDVIIDIAIQFDDKLLVCGDVTKLNGNKVNNIFRLNSDGSFDSSFKIKKGFNISPGKILVLKNQDIIYSGNMSTFEDIPCTQIVKCTSEGILNLNFNLDSRLSITNSRFGRSSLLSKDGSIFFPGYFNFLNNNQIGKLLKIRSNGEIDDNFLSISTPGNSRILSLSEESSGSILIGGEFYSVNDIGRNKICKIHNKLIDDTNDPAIVKDVFIYPNPVRQNLLIEFETQNNYPSILPYSMNDMYGKMILTGKIKNPSSTIDVKGLIRGTYILNIVLEKGVISKKVIIN